MQVDDTFRERLAAGSPAPGAVAAVPSPLARWVLETDDALDGGRA